MLIGILLSQNTNDKNAIRAYDNLRRAVKDISIDNILKAPLNTIMEAIKIAGMYRRRAETIKEIAQYIKKNLNGNLEQVLNLPLEEARRELLKIPGVGTKTADVILLMYANKPTFPIDTHIKRISKRLGLVRKKADYEEIRRKLMEIFNPEDYLEAHLRLIMLGRMYCKARKPECRSCPLGDICKYRRQVQQYSKYS